MPFPEGTPLDECHKTTDGGQDHADDDIHYAATFTGKMKHKPKMITTPTGIY